MWCLKFRHWLISIAYDPTGSPARKREENLMFCIKEKDGPITADSNMVTTCQIFAVKNAVPVKPAAEDWNRRFSLKGIREENGVFYPFILLTVI